MRTHGFLARARNFFALLSVLTLFFPALSSAQLGTLPTLVSPVDGQTISTTGTTQYRLTVSNQSGTPYLYLFLVQRGMAPNFQNDLSLGSPVALVEAQNGVNYTWPASLGTGSFNVYVYAFPTSGPEPANYSNVVKVNVVASSDTTPDPFSFTAKTNQLRASTCTSDSIALRTSKNGGASPRIQAHSGTKALITGINAPTPVSVSGASGSEISINGGAWTTSGTITNNQQLEVRHTTSSNFSTTTTSTVDVGGVRASFDCTTEAEDTTPDPFTVAAQTNQALNALCSSQTSGLGGFNSPVIARIDGTGEILTSTGTWVQSVLVGVSDRILSVRQRTSVSPNTATTVNLNIGGVIAAFTCTTGATGSDTTPDPFSFPSNSGVPLNAACTSSPVTITGIDASTPVTVSGAPASAVSVNGGAFTTSTSVLNGQTIVARHTSAATSGTATTSTVDVGGVKANFTCTTQSAGPDTTPDPFTIASKTNLQPGSICTSDLVRITGIDSPTPVSVSNGGEFSQQAGVWAASGSMLPAVDILVRQRAAPTTSATTTVIVNVGGVTSPFACTTSASTSPSSFAFSPRRDVPISSLVTSDTVPITGNEVSLPISIINGEYSINGGPFTTAAGTFPASNSPTIVNTLTVRHTSASTTGADTVTTVSIGTGSATFTSTTVGPDTTPDPFSFPSQTGVAFSTQITSAQAVINGFNTATSISVANGEYSIDGGAFTAASGLLNPPTTTKLVTVQVRHTSASAAGTNTVTTLTIGGVSGTFTSTTIGPDITPDPIAFAEQLGVEVSTPITSNPQTISGINTTIELTITGGEFSINGGAFVSSGKANNGDTVVVRHTSSANFNTPTITTLTLGTTSATFRSVTRQANAANFPTARIFSPVANTAFVAPATIGVNIAIDDPSGGRADFLRVRVQVGTLSQDAQPSTQACPTTAAPRCVVYQAVFTNLSPNRYAISAAVDFNIGGVNGTVGATAVNVIVVQQTVDPQTTSDIALVGASPRIVPGANVSFAVRAVTASGQGISGVPLQWSITNGNVKRADQKAACTGVPNDTPSSQQVTTGANGEAFIVFRASCAAGGREVTVSAPADSGNTKRITKVFQFAGPNQAAGEINLVGYSTNTPLILSASTPLTARVVEGSAPVNGAVTTWALTPANAGTVQSPIQTDENGEAKSTLTLNSGTVEATLNVCVDGRANTCKSYRVRAVVATIVTPATTIANAATQQAIAAPRVQITQIRDRMQQLRNEQTSGFYNGVGVSFPGGRVGTDAVTSESSDKPKEGEKAPSRPVAPRSLSSFALGDVSLTQKPGQVGFDVSTRGLTLGVDYRFSKEWVAGAAVGYSRALTEFNAGGEQKATNVSGSVFAQWLPANNTYLNFAANTGRGSYKIERVASDLSVARASPKGQQQAAQIEAGYMWSGGAFRLQPFVRGETSRGTIDPIVESGSSEALEIEKQRVRANVVSAGVNADYAISSNMGVFIPSARVEFYRESQKIDNSFARLVNGSTVVVPLESDPFDRSYGTAGINLQWLTGVYGTPISTFVGYEHTFGKTGLKVNRFLFGIKIPIQ